VESRESVRGARAGAWLVVLLLALSVAGFAITRVLRSEDDIVNTVVLTAELDPSGEPAEIRFNTTVADANADVFVIDGEEQRVRALQEGEPLDAGEHVFTWDGRDDAGNVVPEDEYGLRVVLNDEGRDIVPPGVIAVTRVFSIERVEGEKAEKLLRQARRHAEESP
jgi:flagellar hook assembly protein FlgD